MARGECAECGGREDEERRQARGIGIGDDRCRLGECRVSAGSRKDGCRSVLDGEGGNGSGVRCSEESCCEFPAGDGGGIEGVVFAGMSVAKGQLGVVA